MKYMLIAGEASGDLHAADLISAIAKLDPDADFRFFGGDFMAKAARRRPEIHYDMLNVMGFSEVIRSLPRLLRNLKTAKRIIASFRPDVLILVDYPSFNLKLAKYAKSIGVRVDYYISPKVWAWKEYRVRQIRKYVDNLYSILPFEVPFFKRHNYKVTYVGNPSVQEMDYALGHLPPRRHFVERQGLDSSDRPIIALLPGSRRSEIRNNLPLMIAAAKRFPDFQYVVGAAPAVSEKFYREVAQDPGLQVVFGCTPTLVKYAQAAVVTSGTATLETALIGTPQVVCYRGNGSRLTYKLMERILKVKHVSLPNLISSNNMVPELLLHNCTPDSIARELSPLLSASPQRDWQIGGCKSLRRRLGTSLAADYAAELIVDSLNQEKAPNKPLASDPQDAGSNHRPRRPRRQQRPNADHNSDSGSEPKQQRPRRQRPENKAANAEATAPDKTSSRPRTAPAAPKAEPAATPRPRNHQRRRHPKPAADNATPDAPQAPAKPAADSPEPSAATRHHPRRRPRRRPDNPHQP